MSFAKVQLPAAVCDGGVDARERTIDSRNVAKAGAISPLGRAPRTAAHSTDAAGPDVEIDD